MTATAPAMPACYCYRYIDTRRLMDELDAVENCSQCGASVRLEWSTDATGQRWSRYVYEGRDGVLW